MEHIEQAGIHSGDSACSLPTYSLSEDIIANIKSQVCNLTKELKVIGLLNAQFAIQGNDIYIIEANPRASRTIPFISKCINKPMAKIAMKCALGVSLKKQGWLNQIHPKFFAVKETVFPFIKFSNSNPELGPEMKSTGEVMGVGKTFGQAFNKATVSSGYKIPQPNEQTKTILISVKDSDKKYIPKIAKSFISAGFEIMSTAGTANFLKDKGIQVKTISKVGEGRPNMIDSVKNKTIGFIINTVDNKTSTEDSSLIRMHAIQLNVFYVTTIAAAQAVCEAIKHNSMEVNSINKLHKLLT
jgi:carbamoyl-phosphate synthase large subunit